MIKAKVYVTLKESILDPQGTAVKKALHSLQYSNVNEVRVGKYIELQIDSDNQSETDTKVREMCDKLLSNNVIENYSFELEG